MNTRRTHREPRKRVLVNRSEPDRDIQHRGWSHPEPETIACQACRDMIKRRNGL